MYTSNRVLVVQDAVVLVVVEENRRQRMLCRSVTKGVRLRTFFEDRFFTSRHEETKGVGLVVVVVVIIIIIVVSHSRWSSSSSSSYTSRGVCVRDFILRTLSERKKSSNSFLMT